MVRLSAWTALEISRRSESSVEPHRGRRHVRAGGEDGFPPCRAVAELERSLIPESGHMWEMKVPRLRCVQKGTDFGPLNVYTAY
jgi:hypothetical protein